MGVIGVDLVDAVSGCRSRRRWPRKKRQNNKREHSTVRARSLRAATSAFPLLAGRASGVKNANSTDTQASLPPERDILRNLAHRWPGH